MLEEAAIAAAERALARRARENVYAAARVASDPELAWEQQERCRREGRVARHQFGLVSPQVQASARVVYAFDERAQDSGALDETRRCVAYRSSCSAQSFATFGAARMASSGWSASPWCHPRPWAARTVAASHGEQKAASAASLQPLRGTAHSLQKCRECPASRHLA
jgi:hypothetical protein